MEDKLENINRYRKYLEYLERITQYLIELPDIDDNSYSFYEFVDELTGKEYARVMKKLEVIESEVKNGKRRYNKIKKY